MAKMWSPLINKSASLPSLYVFLLHSLQVPNISKRWQELNQHKWRDELLTFTAIFVLITRVLASEGPLFEELT